MATANRETRRRTARENLKKNAMGQSNSSYQGSNILSDDFLMSKSREEIMKPTSNILYDAPSSSLRASDTGTSAKSESRQRERNLGVFSSPDVPTSGPIAQATEQIDLASLIEPKKYTGKYKKLRDELHGNIAAIGIMVGGTDPSLQADGIAVIDHSERLANCITDLAEKNDRLYEVLCRLLETGGWAGLILTLASLANAIASNHGVNIAGSAVAALKAGWRAKKVQSDAPTDVVQCVA